MQQDQHPHQPGQAVNFFGSTAVGRSSNSGKCDISGPFLQGKNLEEEVWRRPVKEIAKSMGLEEGAPTLMRKAAYGLVQAPLVLFESANQTPQ